jgi:hypothetical protein
MSCRTLASCRRSAYHHPKKPHRKIFQTRLQIGPHMHQLWSTAPLLLRSVDTCDAPACKRRRARLQYFMPQHRPAVHFAAVHHVGVSPDGPAELFVLVLLPVLEPLRRDDGRPPQPLLDLRCGFLAVARHAPSGCGGACPQPYVGPTR